jgi:hypothetical protein
LAAARGSPAGFNPRHVGAGAEDRVKAENREMLCHGHFVSRHASTVVDIELP